MMKMRTYLLILVFGSLAALQPGCGGGSSVKSAENLTNPDVGISPVVSVKDLSNVKYIGKIVKLQGIVKDFAMMTDPYVKETCQNHYSSFPSRFLVDETGFISLAYITFDNGGSETKEWKSIEMQYIGRKVEVSGNRVGFTCLEICTCNTIFDVEGITMIE